MTFAEYIKDLCGYECKTTFWDDFAIAEHFGTAAIKDTFNRAFEEWKENIVFFTELVLVLNHKIWHFYEKNETYARLYNDLWEKADHWGLDNLKDGDLSYFLQTLD